MSKSYGNIIPLFAPEAELKKLIMRIVTNSQTVEEPKDPDSCNIFALYRNFATPEQIETLRQKYLAGGMGWGEAKNELFKVMNACLAPLRDKYYSLLERKDYIDEILLKGSTKARELAGKKMVELRKIIGLA